MNFSNVNASKRSKLTEVQFSHSRESAAERGFSFFGSMLRTLPRHSRRLPGMHGLRSKCLKLWDYLPFLAVSTCLFLLPCGVRGAQLLANSLTLAPGGSGIVVVSFSSQAAQVSGLQFDMGFDSSAMSVVGIPGSAIRSAGKNLYGADLSAGQRRTLVAGLNQNLLGDGAILTLFVNVLPSASAGTYTISMKNALGTDPAGNAVAIPDASGVIAISGQPGGGVAIQSGGVLNAASLLPGAVSAGEVVTLIGSGIGPLQPATLQVLASGLVSTNLSNTIVSFDSVQAPLLYAGLNQINAVVPFEVSGQANSLLTITHNGQITSSISMMIAPTAPAIFTQNATGTGQAAALNQDGSLNTPLNPATQGSIVTVYVTGAGQTNPPGLTGGISLAPGSMALSTTATIGGVPADVLYSGPSPDLIAGVSQFNLQIPAGASSALAAPILIRIGNIVTQDGVTLSVR